MGESYGYLRWGKNKSDWEHLFLADFDIHLGGGRVIAVMYLPIMGFLQLFNESDSVSKT